jgi:omega-6 fatty acid desaturase (delta-12 desaturase)
MTATTGMVDARHEESVKSPDMSGWRTIVARYQGSSVGPAFLQMATTLIPLGLCLWAMHASLALPYIVTLLLAVPTAGFLVRTFIIMHDCAHGSFLPWRGVNEVLGFITGVLTLTPFAQWRRDHALHHASSGDLDRRGHGDVNTLTVREYLALDPAARLRYRIFRHPAALLGVGPLHLMVNQRFRPRGTATGSKQLWSVWHTNLALAVLITAFSFLIGFKAVVLIYLPAMYIAGAVGVWLFYVQHQFEDAYWEPHQEWDYVTSAIRGSSHLDLPRVLRWFTGNIGLHHVHHLGPRIPNYNLQRCHNENPLFHQVTRITLRQAVSVLRLSLWDEEQRKLVSFREVVPTQAARV